MSLMEVIQRGKTPMPPRLMVYGTEGIGKSTLAAGAPKPIFVQTEDGLFEAAGGTRARRLASLIRSMPR